MSVFSNLYDQAPAPLQAWMIGKYDDIGAAVVPNLRLPPPPVRAALHGASRLAIPGFSQTSIQPDRSAGKTAEELIDAALGRGVSLSLLGYAQEYVNALVTPDWVEEQRASYREAGWPEAKLSGPEWDAGIVRYKEKLLRDGYEFIAAILRKEPLILKDILDKRYTPRWTKLVKRWLGDALPAVEAQIERDAQVVRGERAAAERERLATKKRESAIRDVKLYTFDLGDGVIDGVTLLDRIAAGSPTLYKTKGGATDYYANFRSGDHTYLLSLDKKLGAALRTLHPGVPATATPIGALQYVQRPEGTYKVGDILDLGRNYRFIAVSGDDRPQVGSGPVVLIDTRLTRKDIDRAERSGRLDPWRVIKVAPLLGDEG